MQEYFKGQVAFFLSGLIHICKGREQKEKGMDTNPDTNAKDVNNTILYKPSLWGTGYFKPT